MASDVSLARENMNVKVIVHCISIVTISPGHHGRSSYGASMKLSEWNRPFQLQNLKRSLSTHLKKAKIYHGPTLSSSIDSGPSGLGFIRIHSYHWEYHKSRKDNADSVSQEIAVINIPPSFCLEHHLNIQLDNPPNSMASLQHNSLSLLSRL